MSLKFFGPIIAIVGFLGALTGIIAFVINTVPSLNEMYHNITDNCSIAIVEVYDDVSRGPISDFVKIKNRSSQTINLAQFKIGENSIGAQNALKSKICIISQADKEIKPGKTFTVYLPNQDKTPWHLKNAEARIKENPKESSICQYSVERTFGFSSNERAFLYDKNNNLLHYKDYSRIDPKEGNSRCYKIYK